MEIANNNSRKFNISDSPSKESLRKNRICTDIGFVYFICYIFSLLFLFIAAWLKLFNGGLRETDQPIKFISSPEVFTLVRLINPSIAPKIQENSTYDSISHYDQYLRTGTWIFLYVSIGALLLFSWIVISFWKSKLCTLVGIISLCLLIASHIFASCWIIKEYSTGNHSDLLRILSIYIVPNLIKILIILVVIVVCLRITGISPIAKLIRRSFRAALWYPTLFIFGFIMFGLQASVTFFFIETLKLGLPIHWKFFIFLCVTYINAFFYYLTKAVVFDAISYWHWIKNDNIQSGSVIVYIYNAFRFHSGSAAFGATFIIPFFTAIYAAFTTKLNGVSRNKFTETICKIVLIPCITDFALIETTIHNCGFVEATRKTYKLMVKNSALSLSYIYIVYAHLTLICVIAYLICVSVTACYFDMPNVMTDFLSGIYDENATWFYLFISLMFPVLTIAEASQHTIFMCSLEDNEKDDYLSIPSPTAL